MNHCLLEVDVLEAPQVRYTQDNQMPIAEMAVRFDGIRPDEPPGQLKVVGLGNLAQDLQNRVQVGQRLVIEGRLRINTVTRKDGIKEKRAEFTLSRLHPLLTADATAPAVTAPAAPQAPMANSAYGTAPAPGPGPGPGRASYAQRPEPAVPAPVQVPTWNTSPLVPDLPEGDDDIPF